MTIEDATRIDRVAQRLIVEARQASGSPPNYGLEWWPVWGAKVDRIEINRDAQPSRATIWFPQTRWHQSFNLLWGDMIRIRTDDASQAVVFSGFVTSYLSDYSGGSEKAGSSFERCAVACLDHRWLLAITSPVTSQIARSADDYTDYGLPGQDAISGSYTWLTGRRVIFNEDGKPNSDPEILDVKSSDGPVLCQMPIFADPDVAVAWTAKDMLRYVLSPLNNRAYQYLPIADPSLLGGLDHSDWDNVLNHVVVDGLNVIEAIDLICRNLGWGFREDYGSGGSVTLTFYKIVAASAYLRSTDNTTILHRLHAPAVGENIATAVAEGRKILWSMSLAEDIAAIVNNPWGMGAVHRFEITAELVPAWLDSNLAPDTSEGNANLFFTEADLQDITDPNSKTYYKYYHPRGSSFLRNVGRRWSLNESGRYSPTTYDRGMPFDFKDVLPAEYILDDNNNRLFAPFNRQLLPCLTVEADSLSSVGFLVEFSFDGGVTWQVIPSAISSLDDECGIYIDEANLAELVDQAEGTISGGDLDGVQLNYWSSLSDDKLNSRVFKNGDWNTRVRVTASVQLDQRLSRQAIPSPASGSPFHHSQLYDFSEKYGLRKRTASSVFGIAGQPVREADDTPYFDAHLGFIRNANEDMSISGNFTLERLWLGDGSGEPDFMIGDNIERITGREYSLGITFGGGVVYPQVVQIIYLPDKQKMKLITRDLRFAEVLL